MNSVLDCINRALQLKDAITRFSDNDMELDGQIDGEDDENTSDGEVGRVVKEMVCTIHPHSLLFLYIRWQHHFVLCGNAVKWKIHSFIYIYIAKVCVFVVFIVLHVTGVWAYFHP